MNVENEKCAIVVDLEGNPHMGIIQFPVPILKGNKEILKNLRTNCLSPNLQNLQLLIFLIWHKKSPLIS